MAKQPFLKDPLNHDYFSRFGAIIHCFARIEYLMQGAMALVAGIDPIKIFILTKGLTYAQKRDALYSYMVMRSTVHPETAKKIRELFDAAHKHNALRNHIAHSNWRTGVRPDSIRPGYFDLRGGKGKIGGFEENERDYTLAELSSSVNELKALINAIISFLLEAGAAPIIAKKMAETIRDSASDVSAPSGSPDKIS